jgi:hypothetical protein
MQYHQNILANKAIYWYNIKRWENVMKGKTRKATFNIHNDVLIELDQAVDRGFISSKNAMVEQALVKELKEYKKQERQKRWQEAAADPIFVKDISEVEADFRCTDLEADRSIS